MLKDKVIGILNKQDESAVLREFFNSEVDENISWDSEEIKEFRKVLADESISFERVDSYGGVDQGSDYWSVYAFTDGMEAVFIKFDGWYASYEGSTYEEFYEVQPVEKTITVFEKK